MIITLEDQAKAELFDVALMSAVESAEEADKGDFDIYLSPEAIRLIRIKYKNPGWEPVTGGNTGKDRLYRHNTARITGVKPIHGFLAVLGALESKWALCITYVRRSSRSLPDHFALLENEDGEY